MKYTEFKTLLVSHTARYLEEISQTLFFRNKFFGFFLLLLFALFSSQVILCGLVASTIGYLYSILHITPKILKQTGLLTINGLFFGVAFATTFQSSVQFYFCLVLGAIALPLLIKASFEILQHWKLTPLIIPYIFTMWIFCLSTEVIALHPKLISWTLNPTLLTAFLPSATIEKNLFESLFFSIGQIFFVKNSVFGFLLLLLVICFNPRRGLFFFLGTALSTVVFYGISKGQFAWHFSFFSCSAGLVALGLAAMPENFSWRTIMLYSVLSLFLTLAAEQFLIRFGLPIFSLPFVLTFWLAELSRSPRLNISWATTKVSIE